MMLFKGWNICFVVLNDTDAIYLLVGTNMHCFNHLTKTECLETALIRQPRHIQHHGLFRTRGIFKSLSNMWDDHSLCLNMSQYVLISLSEPENDWILLNVPEYVWKCLNRLFWLRFPICRNIVIITLSLL